MAVESGSYTPETIARRLEIAKSLWADPKEPIRHWSQGLNEIAKGALGGYVFNQAEKAERGNAAAQNSAMMALLGVPPASAMPATPAAATPDASAPIVPPTPLTPGTRTASPVQEVKPDQFNSIDAMASPPGKFDPNYQPTISASNRSVSTIESGSPAGNYEAIGKPTKPLTGNPAIDALNVAYGKHQVMGYNIGPWTKEVLGRAMTPQEFLQNPDAQDAVFNAKFGQSVQKFGNPQDAASVWFTGLPRNQAGVRQDVNGTTAPAYVNKFTAGMPQLASAFAPTSIPPIQGVAAALNATPSADPNFAQRFDASAGPAGVEPQQPTPVAAPPSVATALNAPVSPVAAPVAPPAATPAAAPPAIDPKAQIAAMLRNPNPAVQRMGQQMAAAYATKHLFADPEYAKLGENSLFDKKTGKAITVGPGFRPLVDPAERTKYGLRPEDHGWQLEIGTNKLIPPPAGNNTVVNNTTNPILAGIGSRFNESMEQAKGTIPQIQGIHEARRALDQGAITGVAADPKLFLGKVANLFGIPASEAVNTEVLRSAVGAQVLAKAKTLGANPSNTDRDYIEKVVGGRINLEEGTIRRLLDMQEKWARDTIRRANAEGAQVLKAQPDELKSIAPLLSVQEPVTYEEFLKTNPIQQPGVDLKKKYGLD